MAASSPHLAYFTTFLPERNCLGSLISDFKNLEENLASEQWPGQQGHMLQTGLWESTLGL